MCNLCTDLDRAQINRSNLFMPIPKSRAQENEIGGSAPIAIRGPTSIHDSARGGEGGERRSGPVNAR